MTTQQITHPQLVTALVKQPGQILVSLSKVKVDLWHAATGISGEAGELLEAILFQDLVEGIDHTNLTEEIGDIYFYVEQLVQRTGIEIDWEAVRELAYNQQITADAQFYHAGCVSVHASQVLDSVKKCAVYNKDLDLELLRNQVHAMLVSLYTVSIMFGITRDECLAANIAKLSKRYASLSYSDKAAQERADKEIPGLVEAVELPLEPRTADMEAQVAAEKSA